MVIELKREFYNNYTCSYFEIVKSRYIRHVLGHHPYKVENYKKVPENMRTAPCNSDEFLFQNADLIKKIVVLPSLHYRISASENSVFPVHQEIRNRDEEKNGKKQYLVFQKLWTLCRTISKTEIWTSRRLLLFQAAVDFLNPI